MQTAEFLILRSFLQDFSVDEKLDRLGFHFNLFDSDRITSMEHDVPELKHLAQGLESLHFTLEALQDTQAAKDLLRFALWRAFIRSFDETTGKQTNGESLLCMCV